MLGLGLGLVLAQMLFPHEQSKQTHSQLSTTTHVSKLGVCSQVETKMFLAGLVSTARQVF